MTNVVELPAEIVLAGGVNSENPAGKVKLLGVMVSTALPVFLMVSVLAMGTPWEVDPNTNEPESSGMTVESDRPAGEPDRCPAESVFNELKSLPFLSECIAD